MKCNKCTKKATVHLTEIVDGKVMEMHLCEECAREHSQHMEQQFGLADLLAGLTDFGKQIPEVQKNVLQCSRCGLTYEDFRKFGRFGCADCYTAFRQQLKVLLKKIHGSNVHLGKKPIKMAASSAVVSEGAGDPVATPVAEPEEETVEGLRGKLHRAIKEEDFELAASLRDRIRELEQKG